MKQFPARYYERGVAYAMTIYAASYAQARSRCERHGWKMEDERARWDDGYKRGIITTAEILS
jgi:hypothetical protein